MAKITYEECIIYKNRKVSAGVPHQVVQGKLFWYYGKLVDISQTEIKLEMEHGFKRIPLNQLMELKLDQRRWDF